MVMMMMMMMMMMIKRTEDPFDWHFIDEFQVRTNHARAHQ
jgi:hypothetical protein